MPRYEQLKSKSKRISYTRQIRNESKEINFKKPLFISVTFIIAAALIFTVVKKYSPMVDIAIKDFFSINHKEAIALESDAVTEDQNKMSFLSNIPLFNFFIKTDTNETLSIMTYETNSKIEASLDMMSDNITNSSVINRESLLPFFNKSGNSNSILYDSGYVDYGDNHHSVLFSNSLNNTLNRVPENNNNTQENDYNQNNNQYETNAAITIEEDKKQNYLEQMILENRKNDDNNNNINNNNSINQNTKTNTVKQNNNTETKKGMFDDILKPKPNVKRETTTMKPASTTTFSRRPPAGYKEDDSKTSDTNKNYNFNVNDYLNNNNNNIVRNESVPNNDNIKNNNAERTINNNNDNSKKNNVSASRKDIIQTSVYTMTNSNTDYNRVINDMINPNNNSIIKDNNQKENNNIEKPNNNNIIKDGNILHNDNKKNNNVERNINNNEYKKEIIKKAQNDINNYNIKKANNNITRDLTERKLKQNSNEGIYLVEYSESAGSITLIFRERKFNNKSSIEEAIRELLIGATDEENSRNIISCIPKDTELLDIFVENNTVYLNFNENFEFNPLGNEGTMVQIYQFVYTATQFEGIDNVIFLINGQLNETIGAEGAIESMPFTRFQ